MEMTMSDSVGDKGASARERAEKIISAMGMHMTAMEEDRAWLAAELEEYANAVAEEQVEAYAEREEPRRMDAESYLKKKSYSEGWNACREAAAKICGEKRHPMFDVVTADIKKRIEELQPQHGGEMITPERLAELRKSWDASNQDVHLFSRADFEYLANAIEQLWKENAELKECQLTPSELNALNRKMMKLEAVAVRRKRSW